MDYFKKLVDLLKIEQEEDRRSYLKLTESASINERRNNGLSWYPIAIKGLETGVGDYLIVELERTAHHDLPHHFRFGATAMLFSNHDAKQDKIDGIITFQSGNRMKVTFKTDELPDWSRNGKLGIDLLFDDNSYKEMFAALDKATVLSNENNQLIDVLTGQKQASFNNLEKPYISPALNEKQQQAVNKIFDANELAIVHGPPGTGKTTTLVEAIKTLIREKQQQILVLAPSNTAVDLLSAKLFKQGLKVLRIGNPARVSEELMSLTLDAQVARHIGMKQIRELKKQANAFRDMAHQYKKNFGKAEREQRKALFKEAHDIMQIVSKTEQYIINDLIEGAQVITATLVGSNHYTISNAQFETVVVDEAAQALEPANWIPILKAQKVVLAGDHCQLPPTIKSIEAAKNGLSTTLFEKCVQLHPEAVVLLEEQYRMNEYIMQYSSKVFYEGRLKAHNSVAKQLLLPEDIALSFIDTAGCGFEEKQKGTSSSNPEEAAFLLQHLTTFTQVLSHYYTKETFPNIGIIFPYKEQISELKNQLTQVPELLVYGNKIAINTIDSFQGQERDIVYISLVRSNRAQMIGFLSDIRRMNVAMTRAKKKLVVIGDSATLSMLPFYENFISYTQSLNAYQSAWEFM